ncbi:MAG TPA: glutamine amidotransferase [Paracoccaceae bacterium]|nr:glutamine amidotransferase [Paracoccaceae bacterium]
MRWWPGCPRPGPAARRQRGHPEARRRSDRAASGRAGRPSLARCRQYGAGRTLAWTTDIGPHWLPQPFVDWPGHAQLRRQALGWLSGV